MFLHTPVVDWLKVLLAIWACILYYVIAFRTRASRKWPLSRFFCFSAAIFCILFSFIGPFAAKAHTHFEDHMVVHLLLGMLAPLLLVFAAPMTLLLRTLPVVWARRVTRILKSKVIRFWSHPIVVSLLNIGGLWILYMTDLYHIMQSQPVIHLVVHFHLFFAGYLFTATIIYIDPVAHRFSYPYRAILLLISIAGHNILSKAIYAHPPWGVPRLQAESAGMWMYYWGGGIEIILIFFLCLHWFKATRPRGLTIQT